MSSILQRKVAIAKVIAKAWTDDNFRDELVKNPQEVLKGFDLDVDPKKEIRIVQNTTDVHYFVLPQKPAAVTSLNEQELYSAAGAELEFTGMVNKDSGSP